MSQDSSFLKTTVDALDTDPEVKSFIHQQILEFNQFVTPDTMVIVLERDPSLTYIDDDDDDEEVPMDELYKHRIAIVLKDGESSIEAEAFSNDVFEAIKAAKDSLIVRLIEIQGEMENPQDRLTAIKEARENKQVH